MNFPYQFKKANPEENFLLAPFVNLAANSMVLIVGGACLSTISSLAMKALGISDTVAATCAVAIPVSIVLIGSRWLTIENIVNSCIR